jgi:hypothetical protein
MIKKLKNMFASVALFSLVLAPAAAPVAVHAQIEEGLESGTCLSVDGNSSTCPDPADAEDKVNSIIQLVINIFSLIVGVISVVMIIIGGLKYITSGGESSNVTGAKNTILYAIIGLVVVALAQFIVRFVLGRVTA